MGPLSFDELINQQSFRQGANAVINQFERIGKALEEQREEAAKTTKALRESLTNLPVNSQTATAIEDQSKALKGATVQIMNYDNALEQVNKTQEQFKKDVSGNDLGKLEDQLQGVGGAAGGAIGNIKALAQSLKALLVNPVVLTITALVAALKLLFDGFKRSAQGAELFARAGGVVQGLLNVITKAATALTNGLISLFEDPLKALKDFGDFLLNNIINRFQALVQLVNIAGGVISDLANGDFANLSERAQEAAKAFIQFNTGLDTNDLIEYANSVIETANAFGDLAVATREVNRANRELSRTNEALISQEEQLNAIADDTTLSFAQREAAAEEARVAGENRARIEVQIARNNLALIENELALRRSAGEEVEELADRQLQAFQALQQAERDLTRTVFDNERTRRELRQDRLERDLDILIDGFDNQKTINERIISNERETLTRRRALLEETQRQSQESFDAQIATIQQFTNEAIDANDLLATSDARALNEKIRVLGLSEIIEGRLLEVIRDRRTAVQDLIDANSELNQSEREFAEMSAQNAAKLIEFEKAQNVERLRLQNQFIQARVQAEIDLEEFRRDQLLRNDELTADQRLLIERKFEAAKAEIIRRGIEDEKQRNRERLTSFSDTLGQVTALSSQFFNFQSSQREAELQAIREQSEEEIEQAEGNVQRQEEIRRQSAEQEKAIRREQAEAEKRNALFVAQTELIAGIARAIASAPFPANLPAIAFATIQGGIQLAAAQAIQVPAFAKGTKSAPGGLSLVGEKGFELGLKPTGEAAILGSDGPSLVDVSKGTRIFTHEETVRMLNDPNKHTKEFQMGLAESHKNERIAEEKKIQMMSSSIDASAIGKELANSLPPIQYWNMDDGELKLYVKKGSSKTQKIGYKKRKLA